MSDDIRIQSTITALEYLKANDSDSRMAKKKRRQWGDAGEERDRAHRAITRVQGLLGPEAVVTAVLGGGRGFAEQVRLVPWGDERVSVDLSCPKGGRYEMIVRDLATREVVGRGKRVSGSDRFCATVRFMRAQLHRAALDGAENDGMKMAHPQDSSVSDMVRKLRFLNRKNARLAESGLAFSERLFNVISPPLTYEMLGHHSSMNGTVADSKLSLKV